MIGPPAAAPRSAAAGTRSLRDGFLRSAERFPERPALQLAADSLSYRELRERAASIAATLALHEPQPEVALTAVFGHRSPTAFAAVLASLLRGHGYVPLNPGFPHARTHAMLARSLCTSVVVDHTAIGQLDAVLEGLDRPMLVLVPDQRDVVALAARWPRHRWLCGADFESASSCRPSAVDPNGIAYLLFTSGSTGNPKGVMVAHRNVTHFVDCMVERYGITQHDRFSQTFDLTFDLSAFDMFTAWERGACLCVPTAGQKMLPGKYITDSGITVWFSVPSTGLLMSRLRMLKPDRYPVLRWSLFCGEALPTGLAQEWAQAAPHSVIENLYGPTELTIACTYYRWNPERSPGESELGLVPIGEPYPGMSVLVADENLQEVPPGATGELLMTGPQLSLGYYCDPERTAAAFIVPEGRREVYYRTGDRVRRPMAGGALTYLGRTDNQIKIQGYRVELGEIEAVARAESGAESAIAVGWPVTGSGAGGIVLFIGDERCNVTALRERLIARLPAYMHPSEVRAIAEFPLNANGKFDRRALCALLEATTARGN